ncbi:signal peptide peptidase SppA [Qipengyuania sediminis]|uniref:signal peptide peptidase SppA n=1 Tax=Qipengyuania sediminis TaxID=1532023 RepID=UPI00105A7763|nr:signal peptide peptidase SppA [Qipengyuania sediminis]
MRFAGRVWRLLVGIKDGLVLVFMLGFFGLLFAILTARPSPAEVRGGALVLSLDGYIVEEAQAIDPFQALLTGEAPVAEYQARDLVRALDAAATDSRITAVVLDLDRFLGGGQVHLGAIGAALDRVRAAKKPVLAFATAYANDGLRLAAHASEIWMDPLGGVLLAGPGGNQLFYKGLLDQLKVTAHVYRVGTFKSAVEPFLLTGMSPEARENATALYGALWGEWQAAVAKARPRANIRLAANDPVRWVADSGGDLGQAALRAGLVDKLGSRAAFDARLVKLVGADAWSDRVNGYTETELGPWLEQLGTPSGGAAIGVVTVAGEIVDGEAGPGSAGGARIAALLDDALANADLKALVVRVDSPGGSVLASEEIRRAILRHKTKGIPIAVSMANVAASGGYWVATPANRIFAEPDTITGSIGIFGVLPSFENAAAAWGVTVDGVKTTPLAGQPDFIGGFTPEVDAIIQGQVESGYRSFLARVSQARRMSPAAVDRIAQGRVWDGGAARQIGLVDQYGGLEDALAWAAGKAGVAKSGWHPVYLGAQTTTYDTILRRWLVEDAEAGAAGGGRDVMALVAAQQAALAHRLQRDIQRLLSGTGMQAYCLECPAGEAAPARPAKPETGWLGRLAALVTGWSPLGAS